MFEPEYLAVVITCFLALAGFLIRGFFKGWETRMIAQDERLDTHDAKHIKHTVKIALLEQNLEHIRTTSDETSKDVKILLRHSNGRQSA